MSLLHKKKIVINIKKKIKPLTFQLKKKKKKKTF